MTKRTSLQLAALIATALTACVTPPRVQTGPNAEVSHDGLVRVDNTRMAGVWVRPDINLDGYDKIILEGAGIEFRPAKDVASSLARSRQTTFPLSEESKKRVVSIASEEFREALSASSRFKLVTEPGPDVLLVRGALLDVASNVPPDSVGRNDIYLSQIGEATLVIEIRDSTSGAILARAIDRRVAEGIGGNMSYSNSASNWADVRRLAQRWAEQLKRGLEAVAAGSLA